MTTTEQHEMPLPIKVLFVCHGNICRSPMAETLFRALAHKAGLSEQIEVASCATSAEELGNPVHPGTKEILARYGLSAEAKRAVRYQKEDYEQYDYLLCMDRANLSNLTRMIGADPLGKVHLLLAFTGRSRDIADPWYTGDFERTFQDVSAGCEALLAFLIERLKQG